jgi:uncharacterized damage-inducible protein DinB
MNKQDVLRLFEYNVWANHKVWGWVVALSEEQFNRPSDYSIGSVHKQIVHMMDAESVWLARVRGAAPEIFHDAAVFPTRESIRSRWDNVESAWWTYLNGLPDGAIQGTSEYISRTDGKLYRTPVWESLMQIINHSTDHRSQILALIYQLGGQTGPHDFIYYTWENPAQT